MAEAQYGRGQRVRRLRGNAPEPVVAINGNNSLVLHHTSEGRLYWRRPATYREDPNAILDDAIYKVNEKLQFSFTQHAHGRNIYIADVYRESNDAFDLEGDHFKRSMHALCLSVFTRLRKLTGNQPIPIFSNNSTLFSRANVRMMYQLASNEMEEAQIRNWSSANTAIRDKTILNVDLFPMFRNNLLDDICPSWINEFVEHMSRAPEGSGGPGAEYGVIGYQFSALLNDNLREPSLTMDRSVVTRSAAPRRDVIIQIAGTRNINVGLNGGRVYNSSEVLYTSRIPQRRIPVPPVEPLAAGRQRAITFGGRGNPMALAPRRMIEQYFPEGGCRETVNELLNQMSPTICEKTARQVKGNSPGFMMDLNNMVVWCPNVKNNNCFFACAKYVILQESKNKKEIIPPLLISERVDVWRTHLKLGAKKMVDFRTIYRFNQMMLRRNIRIYDEHHNLISTIYYEGDESEMHEKYRPSNLPIIDLVLFHEHYFVITRHTLALYMCSYCGKRDIVNMDKHTCNANTVSYYNKRVTNCIVYEDKRFKENEKVLAKPYLWENLLFYDFETFFNGVKHQVYAVGAIHVDSTGAQHYFSFTGDTALETFFMYLRHMYEQKISLTLISYNGSNFDHYFLLEEQIRTGDKIDEFVMNKGRLLQITFLGHKLLDLWNFLGPASLDSNCKSYQISVSKHVFPHLFIRDWKHLDYVGTLLDEEHYPAHMRDKYNDWRSKQPSNYEFNLMQECEHYLKLDVECLAQLGFKFMQEMWNNFQIYLPNYMTLSQTAFGLWRASLNPNWSIPLPVDPVLYDMTNEATYGGRCHFVKRFFKSSTYLEGITPYDEIEDYLVDLDVVSLYPASMMSVEFPCGPVARVESDADVAVLQEWLDSHGELPVGIFEVSVKCPTHYLVSPLPRKNDKGHTVWNNLHSERQVYTNVDIRTGLRYGYQFKIKSAFVWKEKQPLFGQYIHDMFQNKAKQDVLKQSKHPDYNPAAREVFKKLMNALYGKMMQKRQFEDHEFIDNSIDEEDVEQNKRWTKFLDAHEGVQYKELTDSVMMMSGSRHDFQKTVTKPHYLGAFILSHSRRIMNDMYDVVDPTRLMDKSNYSWTDSMKNSFFYTDTDSLIVHSSQMAQCQCKMGKDLGMLADELDGGKIIEGYFLSPKLYCVKYITPDGKVHEKVRAKGIPNSLLEFDDYKNMYLNNDPSRYDFVQIRRIQQDVNGPQLSVGMEPFTIISVLDAHRTLNAKHTYGAAGELGGRRVLDSVLESVPLGFEANEPVYDDVATNYFDWNTDYVMNTSMVNEEEEDMIYFSI